MAADYSTTAGGLWWAENILRSSGYSSAADAVSTATSTLAYIQMVMSGEVWDADTHDDVAQAMRTAGYTIDNSDEYE